MCKCTYIYMGDKSTSWERAWRSGRTCTVFRDQTADIYTYKYIYRDSLFGRAKAPYVCMWCQPVTWYTIGWSVLCKCTHARNTKKRPLSSLPPRHVHSSHGLLSRSFVGPLKHPRRQEICHGIYKDVKIFYEALVIKSLTSKS
jgi:hypothetical protein